MSLLIAFSTSLMFFGYFMVSYIDIKTKRIPNSYLILISFVTFLEILFRSLKYESSTPLLRGLVACFLTFAALLVLNLIKGANFGMGDVKFGAVLALGIGQWGISAAFAAIAIAFLLGGFFSLVWILIGKGRKSEIPFGPFLVAGILIMYFLIIRSDQFF